MPKTQITCDVCRYIEHTPFGFPCLYCNGYTMTRREFYRSWRRFKKYHWKKEDGQDGEQRG